MNSMQRQFGKLTHKGGGDDAKVSVLLQDFEEADKMLAKIIDASKAWRDAWVSIITTQLALVTSVEELYNPIIGANADGHGHEPVLTPQEQLDRSYKLKQAYSELKTEMLEDVSMMNTRIIKPATDAKDYIQPLKKTIKKRENKRLDFERYFDKVTSATKKQKRSEREDASLARAEVDLSRATDAFNVADSHLRKTLPPVITAAFAILPHLLGTQIMIQNTLLAQYYTTLHRYCEQEGFPSPPPPMAEVISQWNSAFMPIQLDVESINTIARGKVVHTSMQLGDDPGRRTPSVTALNSVRNDTPSVSSSRRGTSPNMITGSKSPTMRPENRVMRIPSSNSIPSIRSQEFEEQEQETEPRRIEYLSPGYSSQLSHSPGGPTRDYFARDRQASGGSISPGVLSVVGKKKPPPPPPKRIKSVNPDIWVTAMYGFEGQEVGDLSFKEGDRIKVVKKTGSTDDWWDGEIRGLKGRFPANYCETAG